MYMAMTMGAGPLMVIEAEKFGDPEIKSVVKAHHVFDGVDRHTALADLPENTVGIAIESVKCRPIECRAKPMCALVARKIVETARSCLQLASNRRTDA